MLHTFSHLHTKWGVSPLVQITILCYSTSISWAWNLPYSNLLPPYCLQHYNIVFMMTSSNGNISRVTGLCAGNSPGTEFPTQRPVTRRFEVFFDLRLNKRLSKQSWGGWFETLSHPLWRHRNVEMTARCWSRLHMYHFIRIPPCEGEYPYVKTNVVTVRYRYKTANIKWYTYSRAQKTFV